MAAINVQKMINADPGKYLNFQKIDGSGVKIFAVKGAISALSNSTIIQEGTRYDEVRFDKNTYVNNVIAFSRMNHHLNTGEVGVFYFASASVHGGEACILVGFDDGEDLYTDPNSKDYLAALSGAVFRKVSVLGSGILLLTVFGAALIPVLLGWAWVYKPIRLNKLYTKALQEVAKRPVSFKKESIEKGEKLDAA